jgi:hypothetical protein
MPEEKITDQIEAVRVLLREGRTTEADRLLDTLDRQEKERAERERMKYPPPGPRTLAQLTLDFYETVADILGNNPRLLALITEIKGKAEPKE